MSVLVCRATRSEVMGSARSRSFDRDSGRLSPAPRSLHVARNRSSLPEPPPMTFSWPWALLSLLIIPIVAGVVWLLRRRRRRAAVQVTSIALVPGRATPYEVDPAHPDPLAPPRPRSVSGRRGRRRTCRCRPTPRRSCWQWTSPDQCAPLTSNRTTTVAQKAAVLHRVPGRRDQDRSRRLRGRRRPAGATDHR